LGILAQILGTKKVQHFAKSAGTGPAESVTQLVNLGVSGNVKTAYIENPWVYAAIKAISTNISGVPFRIRKLDSKGMPGDDIKDVRNPWVSLFADPHPLMDKTQLWKATSINYEADGEVFWVLRNSAGKPISSPNEVPSQIDVVPSKGINERYNQQRDMIIGWGLSYGNRTDELEFFQVIRYYEYNPIDILKSMSPAEAASLSISIDHKSHLYNEKFFKNGGQISGYLIDENQDSELNDNEIRLMQSMWDSQYSGLANAHRTPMLTNGIKFTPTGSTQKDMDFRVQIQTNREEILGAFNTPEGQVGLTGGQNYSNSKNADRAFFSNNLIPKMKYFSSVLNTKLLHKNGVECYFDFTQIEALKDERDMKVSVAKSLYELGYSLNEINKTQELGMEDVDKSWANKDVDARKVASNKSNSGTKVSSGEEKDRTTDELRSTKDKEGKKNKSQIDSVINTDLAELFLNKGDELTAFESDRFFDEIVDPYADKAQPKLVSLFTQIRNEQLKLLDEKSDVLISGLDDVMFDIQHWIQKYSETMTLFTSPAGKAASEFTKAELEVIGFNISGISDEEIASAVAAMYTNGRSYPIETLYSKIKSNVKKGVDADESINKLKARVRDSVKIALVGTKAIAATEILRASNIGRNATATQVDNVGKVWHDVGDDLVRSAHVDFNSVGPVGLAYEYDAGLRFPGDPSASPAQVVNCRCHIEYIKLEEADNA
tara:strand:- start:8917 stop:11067 length:2151 start_codon:yes stop_codon:yes gene_type:complete